MNDAKDMFLSYLHLNKQKTTIRKPKKSLNSQGTSSCRDGAPGFGPIRSWVSFFLRHKSPNTTGTVSS